MGNCETDQTDAESRRGLRFRVSEVACRGAAERSLRPDTSAPLSPEETQRILGLLEPLTAEEDEARQFAFPALAVSPGLAGTLEQSARDSWWDRPWFDHQNLRGDRVEAFCALLWDGCYRYEYLARATTLGRFIVPPARAKEMYHPETFGCGKTDVVIVE